MNSHHEQAVERGAGEAPLYTPRPSVLAERMGRLGTETAFAVSAEAAAWKAQGHTVYPFHLGDMDLATPENIVEAAFRAIRAGKTGYCPNAGIPELREALADEITATHGVPYGPANVAVQPGGKPVIEKFLLTLMDPGDEVLYPSPGFPIYESQIEFLGGVAVPYGFVPGQGQLPARLRRHQGGDHAQDQAAHLQQPAQPHRRREPGRRDRGARRARDRARPLRAQRRGLLGRALLRHEQVDRLAAGHGRAHRDPLHVQQEVRDDRVAARSGDRPGGHHRAHRDAQRQPGVLHHALHPVGRRRGAHRRPVGPGRRSCACSRSGATWPWTS